MHNRQLSETNAVIMSIGTLASQSSSSCRDKGWGGVDEGALCLSSSGYDPLALRNPDESRSHKDKHKSPTHPHVHPLSLQNFPTPHRSSIVTLSAAKGLACWAERCFAALSMTGQVVGAKFHQDGRRTIPGRRLIP
jgi:hypothetical protein